eukprot:Rmarinus@m.2599
MKWSLDLYTDKTGNNPIPDPPGYSSRVTEVASVNPKQTEKKEQIKKKKMWELAYSPVKGYLMSFFMMWMSGSRINIFSIMFVYMTFSNSLSALLGAGKVFTRFDDGKTDIVGAKAVYLLLQCVPLLAALYKCDTLGLLPTSTSDWLIFLPNKTPVEYSLGGVVL